MLKKKRVVLLGGVIGLVVLIFSINQFGHKPKPVEDERQQFVVNISNIALYGDRDQLVSFTVDGGGRYRVGSNHLISVSLDRPRSYRDEKPKEGDYTYDLTVYDLTDPDFKARTLDLVELVEDYDSDYYVDDIIMMKNVDGADYLSINLLSASSDEEKVTYLNLDTEELVQEVPVSLQASDLDSPYKTNLDQIIEENGFILIDGQIGFSERWKTKYTETNLESELPDLYERIVENNDTAYFRVGMFTQETFFQYLRHLSAPPGQDQLEVVFTKYGGQETVPVNTYDEWRVLYDEWLAQDAAEENAQTESE